MSAEPEDNIDLYADTDDGLVNMKFEPEDADRDPETDELFDDVITARMNNDDICVSSSVTHPELGGGDDRLKTEGLEEACDKENDASSVKKFSVYVGNLTWWTTDQDIEDLVKDIGVEDMVEVKFFENRGNGQSKGFCSVFVGSESSLRIMFEKLPKKEVHGKNPVVTPPSKAALAHFESQSKTRPCPPANPGGPGMCGARGPIVPGMPPAFGMPPVGMRMPGSNRGSRCATPMCAVSSPPSNRLVMKSQPGPHQHPPNFNSQRQPLSSYLHNSRPPPPFRPLHQHCQGPPPGFMDHRGPPPHGDWMHRPVHHYPYHPHQGPPVPPPTRGPPLGIGSPPGPYGMPVNGPPPAPHANPAFFQPHHNAAQTRPMLVSPEGQRTSEPTHGADHFASPQQSVPVRVPSMSESEIEAVMSRNRTVSSSAISRAVADAATGDFASAIETLVTAISLIRQSKVANEDRCRVLVNSLQDTLHGIESKSYGRHRGHGRSRTRSRSRERIKMRKIHRHHSSREREIRARSRERYFEHRRSRSSSRGRELFDRNLKLEDRYRDRERHERERGVRRVRDEDHSDNHRLHRR